MKHHNKPSSIRTPLQSTTKSGKNIFVYIRRSTTNKQELSLQKQEDNARETLERNGFHENDVEYYIESKTAFNKVRVDDGKVIERRKEFDRMLKDIDSSSEPVTILTYEHSRLSRNDYDNQAILDRLFNEYKDRTKGSIEKIMFNDGEIRLSSTINNEDYAIQGRSVPFQATDVVPLKYKVTTAGNYIIGIDHMDGLFLGNQEVYLNDNLTVTVHDLKSGNYSFASEIGTFDTRFQIVYANALGVPTAAVDANQIIVYKNNEDLRIQKEKDEKNKTI